MPPIRYHQRGKKVSSTSSSAVANDASGANRSWNMPLMAMLTVAVVATAMAAAFIRKKRKNAKSEHALKGSLVRRMSLFDTFAAHTESVSRPPRRVADACYNELA